MTKNTIKDDEHLSSPESEEASASTTLGSYICKCGMYILSIFKQSALQ